MLTHENTIVETHPESVPGEPPFYRVRVILPQLDLTTPQLFTVEHAEEMKELIINTFNKCNKCAKK